MTGCTNCPDGTVDRWEEKYGLTVCKKCRDAAPPREWDGDPDHNNPDEGGNDVSQGHWEHP